MKTSQRSARPLSRRHESFRRWFAAPLFAWLVCLGSPAMSLAAGEAEGALSPDGPLPVVAEATALVNSSLTATEVEQRNKLLTKAQMILESFLKENPTHKDAPNAELALGAVFVTAGKADVSDSRQMAEGTERDAVVKSARERFRAAEKLFTTAVDQFGERLKAMRGRGFPKDSVDDAALRLANRLRGDLTQALMYQAAALEELAGTYDLNSVEAKENYKAAADRYEQIYKDYRTFVVGLMARLKHGECTKQLGDTRRALGLFTDILGQPDLKQLHPLRVNAMFLSLECWTSDREKMYILAFSQGEEYLAGLPRNEELWPAWQAVRYHTARGYFLAATEKKKDGGANPDRAEWLGKAREHAVTLANLSGPYKPSAEKLLEDVAKAEAVGGNDMK